MYGQPNPQGNNNTSHRSTPRPANTIYGSEAVPPNMAYNQHALAAYHNAYYIATPPGYAPVTMPSRNVNNWDPEVPDIFYENVNPIHGQQYGKYPSPRTPTLDPRYNTAVAGVFAEGSSALSVDLTLSPTSSTTSPGSLSSANVGNMETAGGDDDEEDEEAGKPGRPKQPRRVIEERSRDKVKIAIVGLKDLLTRHGFPPHQTSRRANFIMHATSFVRRVIEERDGLRDQNQLLRRELEATKRERDQYARLHMPPANSQGGPYFQYPQTH